MGTNARIALVDTSALRGQQRQSRVVQAATHRTRAARYAVRARREPSKARPAANAVSIAGVASCVRRAAAYGCLQLVHQGLTWWRAGDFRALQIAGRARAGVRAMAARLRRGYAGQGRMQNLGAARIVQLAKRASTDHRALPMQRNAYPARSATVSRVRLERIHLMTHTWLHPLPIQVAESDFESHSF